MERSSGRKRLREQLDSVAIITHAPAGRYIKSQQCAKIAELRQALLEAGFCSLNSQAHALGLGRSTTWSILRAGHKATGLTGSIIRRILSSAELPPAARGVIEDYVAQKLAGAYGHDKKQLRKFQERVRLEKLPAR
jgi:hypothetical protein